LTVSEHTFLARHCPRNSPRAAARIVALALISNGEIKPSELFELDAIRAHEQLGLTKQQWHDVVDEMSVCLQESARQARHARVDARLIARLLDDVDDVVVQRLVLRLCTAVIHADNQVDDGESTVLRAAIDRWDLYAQELEDDDPALYGLDFQVVPRGARWA
jgi:hypothetical protein